MTKSKKDDPDALATKVEVLVRVIKPLLAGHHPGVQSAALADLLARWLAGHKEEYREEVLAEHIELVRSLIEINERIAMEERRGKGH